MSTIRSSARGLFPSVREVDIREADEVIEVDVNKPEVNFVDDESPAQVTKKWNEKLYKVTFCAEELYVYTRPTAHKPRATVLNSINAIFKPGTTTALMGPSGAGKTTLLNVLSGRTQNSLSVEAKALKLNGASLTSKEVKAVSSLVPQDDILIAVLTPRETITYGAKLMLKATPEEIEELVEKTLKLLSLTRCADSMVGDADTKGISGGERKRASIGLELITNPSCIFLDEPTSGLDSKVALDVVKTLQDLAAEGKTIVCTIHQPSFECFMQFDRLLLLNRGQVAFQGKTDAVTEYFTSIGYPCPSYLNPADHVLNALSRNDFMEDFSAPDNKLYDEYVQYSEDVGASDFVDLKTRKQESNSELTKIPILIERSFYVTYKDKKQLRTRLLQVILVGVVAGLTYLQLERTQIASFDRQSALLMMLVFINISSVMTTINSIPMEKTMLMREYNNGVYEVRSYFLSRITVYYTFQTFYVAIYSIIVYYLVGLEPSGDHFLTFFSAVFIGSLIAVTLGFLFGSIFPTVQQATSVVPMLILPMILFSGLLVSFENIPIYFIWMYYISFMQYVFRILIVNEFEDLAFEPCSEDDFFSGRCPFGLCGGLGLTTDEDGNEIFDANACSGQLLLEASDYDSIENRWSFLFLLINLVVALCASFVGIYKFLNPSFRILPFDLKKLMTRKRTNDDLA